MLFHIISQEKKRADVGLEPTCLMWCPRCQELTLERLIHSANQPSKYNQKVFKAMFYYRYKVINRSLKKR